MAAGAIPNHLAPGGTKARARLKPLVSWVFYGFILLLPYRMGLWITDFWNLQKVVGALLLLGCVLLLARGRARVPREVWLLCAGLLAVRLFASAAAYAFGGHEFNTPMLVSWTQFLLVLMAGCLLVETPREARRVLAALVVSGAVSCVVFLAQYKLASEFLQQQGVSEDQPVRELGFAAGVDSDSGRLFKDRENDINKTLDLKLGAVGDPTTYALFLLCLLPINMEFLRRSHQAHHHVGLALGAVALALNYLTIVMSYSRTAWVLAILMTGILLHRFHADRRKLAAALLVLLLVALPALQALNALPALETRLAELTSLFTQDWQKDTSGQMRVAIQRAAWELFTYNPLFGVGMGNLPDEAVRYSGLEVAQTAENLYLQLLANGGLLSVAAFAALFVWMARRRVYGRTLKSGFGAALKLSFAVFLLMSVTLYTEFQIYIYVMGAVLLGEGIAEDSARELRA